MEDQSHKYQIIVPKRVREYMFELLSTFIAVALAFLSQYYFQYKSDRSTEHALMISMVADLRIDIKNINELSSLKKEITESGDKLVDICYGNYSTRENQLLMYYCSEPITDRKNQINFTQTTLSQLKNAGGMKLITDSDVSTSITEYDNEVRYLDIFAASGYTWLKEFLVLEEGLLYERTWINDTSGSHATINTVFLNRMYATTGSMLISNDKLTVVKYGNMALNYVNYRNGYTYQCEALKIQAQKLISLIQSRYHIE